MVLATRILIFVLAASSLNLLIGFGGLVSFGHAAYFGGGAYLVAILMHHGVSLLWITWPLAIFGCALAAAAIGAICLRTRGVYFIMITLAFAQMVYYLLVSLKTYGGDDGLPMAARSELGFGPSLKSPAALYYAVVLVVAAAHWWLFRLINSRFGRALQAVRENATRAEAIGLPVYRVQLACFVIGGALAGLAGVLLANLNMLASPNALMWTQSGTLMIMVILGGAGSLYGGAAGAALLLVLEEVLAEYSVHWQLGLGVVLLLVVLFSPNGLAGLFAGRRSDD